MTSKYLLALFALISMRPASALSQQNGEELVKKMYARYAGKWYPSLTFSQTTEFYRNDSLRGQQVWHEVIVFPNDFRIDFGSKDSGNAVILKLDSSYLFTHGKLSRVRVNDNDLIFLLGGLYFYPLDKTLEKLKSLGYDLQKIQTAQWKGKPVWVIGDTSQEKKANQLWIDQENLYLVRMFEFHDKLKEEGIFDNHLSLGGGWTETKATFYFNDHLAQVETYHDCVVGKSPGKRFFDPTQFMYRE